MPSKLALDRFQLNPPKEAAFLKYLGPTGLAMIIHYYYSTIILVRGSQSYRQLIIDTANTVSILLYFMYTVYIATR